MSAIKIVELPQSFKSIANRIFRGEKELSAYPKNESLILITEKQYNQFVQLTGDSKATVRKRLKDNLRALQNDALNSGSEEMSIDEINAVIKECRQIKRGC